MLALIFAKSPKKFSVNDETVQKVMVNNVAWPKLYLPRKYDIIKYHKKKTEAEIAKEILKEKHSSVLSYLPKY